MVRHHFKSIKILFQNTVEKHFAELVSVTKTRVSLIILILIKYYIVLLKNEDIKLYH